jgi:hypothetical protein
MLGPLRQASRLDAYSTHYISSMDCNDIHLLSMKTLNKDQPPINIEDLNEDVQNDEPEHKHYHEDFKPNNDHHEFQNPPYLEILSIDKPLT